MRSVASRLSGVAIALVVCFLVYVPAHSLSADDSLLLDTVNLVSGGKILGKTKEIVDGKQKFLLVETPDGGILKLKLSQVSHINRAPAVGPEYLERRAKLADTVEAHWEMQDWCQKNNLQRQREYHLLQIVRLDPDHTAARSRLGYRIRDGVWVHERHFFQNHGYIHDDRGDPRLPASMTMAEFKDANHKQSKGWSVTIRSAIRKYKQRNDASALNEFAAITDPAAVDGLIEALKVEEDRRIQKLLIETLGGIKSSAAQNNLVVIAMATDLSDPLGREYREICVRLLKQPHFSQSGVVSSLLPFLRPTPETANERVQKAAWLVGQMGDSSAVPALIDALVTTHKILISAGGGSITAGQGSNGSGMRMGDNKPKYRTVHIENQTAYDALRLLTDTRDYGFDKQAWLDWYIDTRAVGTSNLGRDE